MEILVLINRGAAMAVLTYIGNASIDDARFHTLHATLPQVKRAIMYFCAGFCFVALASILAYIAQLRPFKEENEQKSAGATVRYHAIPLDWR